MMNDQWGIQDFRGMGRGTLYLVNITKTFMKSRIILVPRPSPESANDKFCVSTTFDDT